MAATQPVRGGGVTAVHVWLIVFVALWLVSTVLAVLLYTGREDLQISLQAAQQEAQQYMHKNEAGRFKVYLDQAGDRQSLASILDNQRIALARLIGVDETSSAVEAEDVVNRQIAALGDGAPQGAELPDLEGADLLTAVKELGRAWQVQAQSALEEGKRLAAATERMEAIAEQHAAKAKAWDAELTKLRNQLADASAKAKEAVEEKDRQAKEHQRKLTKVQDDKGREIVEKTKLLTAADREIRDLQGRLDGLQEQLKQFRPKVPSLDVADGRIIRTRPEEGIVYIDLGQGDHLTPGLRFQVFSGETGAEQTGRGKAAIEVVRILDTTAECRVVESSSSDPIMVNDYVMNVVYDRKRKYRFVVEGDFDVDGDGKTDPRDADRIRSWVGSWGGEVVTVPQTLPKSPAGGLHVGLETVDFVVLGGEPSAPPRDKAKRRITPEERERRAKLRRIRERFDAIKQEAYNLSLPVLTQAQFLHFVGRGGKQATHEIEDLKRENDQLRATVRKLRDQLADLQGPAARPSAQAKLKTDSQ